MTDEERWTQLSKVQSGQNQEPHVSKDGVDVTPECWMRWYARGVYLVVHREEPQPGAVLETEVGKLVWGDWEDESYNPPPSGYTRTLATMPESAFEPSP